MSFLQSDVHNVANNNCSHKKIEHLFTPTIIALTKKLSRSRY